MIFEIAGFFDLFYNTVPLWNNWSQIKIQSKASNSDYAKVFTQLCYKLKNP